MALSIIPAIDRWLYQTDAFTIKFEAYDDNGVQCYNNQMSIQYNITYDGTMPDLLQMQRVYGDASGIISLVIINPCVISLYGIHLHDVNDPSKGEVIEEIAMNYKLPFQPVITKMTVTYIGPDIPITNSFNGIDLLIKAEYSDGSIKTISPNDCIIKDYNINEIGPNIKSLTYIDPLLGTHWDLEFIVNGVRKLLSLEARYSGERRILGDTIFQEEIIVYGTFLTSLTNTEQIEIHADEWQFVSIPIITKSNNGIFIIEYNKKQTTVVVPYDIVTSLELNVWYEGDKIEVGKSYNPNNVVVYLVYPDGERRRIYWKHCQIDSYLVSEEGYNWYTITYKYESEQISQQFPVEGIIYRDYIDLNFKVLYIIDKTNDKEGSQEDLTSEFEKALMFDDTLILDWSQFLTVVNHLQKYGLYIVTVPKSSGLSNHYDMDWEVLCINKNTLKANVKKIYNKEEANNGDKENN